jgi:hypothetical protein
MVSLILNALGFDVGDNSLSLSNTWNEQMRKKVELCLDQIELVMRRLEQRGKKEICVDIMIKYSTS